MATTFRVLVESDEPLDGVSPLSVSDEVFDRTLGLGTIVVPVGRRFGVFDPGLFLRAGGQQSSHLLCSLTVLSRGAPEHAPDSFVALRPPGSFTGLDRTLFTFAEEATGIVPMFPSLPIPPGHELVFNTVADGANPGPHLIQMTFEWARLPTEVFTPERAE